MEELRSMIDAHGGLVTLGDLARRWGISRTRVAQLATYALFPAPAAVVGNGTVKLYALNEVDAWRSEQLALAGSQTV